MYYNLQNNIIFDLSSPEYKKHFDEIDVVSDEIFPVQLSSDISIFGMLKDLFKMYKYFSKFQDKSGNVNTDKMIEFILSIHKSIILLDTSIISHFVSSNIPYQFDGKNTDGMSKYIIIKTDITLEIPDVYTKDNYKDIFQDKFGSSYDILNDLYNNDMLIGLFKQVMDKFLELLAYSFLFQDVLTSVSTQDLTLNKYQNILFHTGKFFDLFSQLLIEKKSFDDILKKMGSKKYKKFYKKSNLDSFASVNFRYTIDKHYLR